MSVIDQTLSLLRLRGTVYFESRFRAPWGMAIPARDIAAFHVVVDGECWVRVAGSAHHLKAGDVALVTAGDPHELVSSIEGEAEPADRLLEHPRGSDDETWFGGGGDATTLVCGHFEYRQQALHPMFTTLPPLIQISLGKEQRTDWLSTAAQLAAAESSRAGASASAVVDRLAEALLLQTLRIYFEQAVQTPGFLAAVADPKIGRALTAMHGAVDRGWSVQELARESGLSRTAFADRFRVLVGESPMRYLARWRMLRAEELLSGSELSIADIADRVGYRSEFAFAKAFKRTFGEGPGAVRKERRAQAAR